MRDTMRSPENVLGSLRQHSKDRTYRYERIYRLLYNKQLYETAYQNIYAKPGNMTEGTDNVTADGMTLSKNDRLIEALKDESYQPKPARRVYIPKKNGKLRPLGIQSFDGKLIQEVIRMILENIYEDDFEECSCGFRPGRSCHTALNQIRRCFTGARWFIEGDIQGFFDNIDHNVLIQIMGKRIKDDRFLRLIRKFLNAGYMEEKQFRATYSGTAQGGIISPILANIYLNELDKKVMAMAEAFSIGTSRKKTPEVKAIQFQIAKRKRKMKGADEETRKRLHQEIVALEQKRLHIPPSDPMQKDYRRLHYVRYADDWLIGIIGTKEECEQIKREIGRYLKDELHLTLSEEKTLITNAKEKAHFLGYDVSVRKSTSPAAYRNAKGCLQRHYTAAVVLRIPDGLIRDKLLNYGAMSIRYHDGKEVWKPMPRKDIQYRNDLDILDQYNAEIRGLYNYYSMAQNCCSLHVFGVFMEYSLYKTLAAKYRCTKGQIIDKYSVNGKFCVHFTDGKGRQKQRFFYDGGFRKKPASAWQDMDFQPRQVIFQCHTYMASRLRAGICELCGKRHEQLQMHEIRSMKLLTGNDEWQRIMRDKRRKTLAVCPDCHRLIHSN